MTFHKDALDHAGRQIRQLQDQLAAAESRLAEAEKDAERWRYLQKNPFRAIDLLLAAVDVNRPSRWHEQTDAAIDAAREQEKP